MHDNPPRRNAEGVTCANCGAHDHTPSSCIGPLHDDGHLNGGFVRPVEESRDLPAPPTFSRQEHRSDDNQDQASRTSHGSNITHPRQPDNCRQTYHQPPQREGPPSQDSRASSLGQPNIHGQAYSDHHSLAVEPEPFWIAGQPASADNSPFIQCISSALLDLLKRPAPTDGTTFAQEVSQAITSALGPQRNSKFRVTLDREMTTALERIMNRYVASTDEATLDEDVNRALILVVVNDCQIDPWDIGVVSRSSAMRPVGGKAVLG